MPNLQELRKLAAALASKGGQKPPEASPGPGGSPGENEALGAPGEPQGPPPSPFLAAAQKAKERLKAK